MEESLVGGPSLFILDAVEGKEYRVAFENEAPSAHRMKSVFLFTLWSWAKLYSVDNLNSLVGFFVLVGV